MDAHMTTAAWVEDDQRNIDYYTRLVQRYGIDSRAIDWGSAQSQQLRFEVLANVGGLRGTRILDVGCGLGDLLTWLGANQIEVDYTGIDITPEMINIAQGRFPRGRFLKGGLDTLGESELGRFDYVFASGIFARRRAA